MLAVVSFQPNSSEAGGPQGLSDGRRLLRTGNRVTAAAAQKNGDMLKSFTGLEKLESNGGPILVAPAHKDADHTIVLPHHGRGDGGRAFSDPGKTGASHGPRFGLRPGSRERVHDTAEHGPAPVNRG